MSMQTILQEIQREAKIDKAIDRAVNSLKKKKIENIILCKQENKLMQYSYFLEKI